MDPLGAVLNGAARDAAADRPERGGAGGGGRRGDDAGTAGAAATARAPGAGDLRSAARRAAAHRRPRSHLVAILSGSAADQIQVHRLHAGAAVPARPPALQGDLGARARWWLGPLRTLRSASPSCSSPRRGSRRAKHSSLRRTARCMVLSLPAGSRLRPPQRLRDDAALRCRWTRSNIEYRPATYPAHQPDSDELTGSSR